jgi:hypothetical protein
MTKMNRRKFLYGVGSTIISLPTMDFMLNSFGTAFASGASLPQRFILFNGATSLVTSNPGGTEGMTPINLGANFTTPYCMQALDELGLKSDLSVISGLFVNPAGLGGDGGYESDYHEHATKSKLTGVSHGWKFHGGESWRVYGRSPDQVIADSIGGNTKFANLVLQLDSNPSNFGISYKKNGNQYTWNASESSPMQAYQRLFTDFSNPTDPQDDLMKRLKQSSISYVKDDLTKLQNYLGTNDRAKLEEHLQNIRDFETRLLAAANEETNACQALTIPSDPPKIKGKPTSKVHDIPTRADLFIDLIHMALACDLTRSVSLNVTPNLTGAGMYHPDWADAFHDVQHNLTMDTLNEVNEWQFRQYAKLLKKLKDSSEGTDSNLLNNSAAVYIMEGGNAGRAADGGGDRNHSTDNMVCCLAGRAGGITPKGHIKKQDAHPMKLFNTAFNALNVDEPEESEVKGHFTDLF